MSKNITGLAILFVIVGLLVGGLATYGVFPREVTKEVIKTITVETPVEKIVEVEKTIEVEVEKDFSAYKDDAVSLCLEELDLDKYQEANVKNVFNIWSITFSQDNKKNDVTTITINEMTIKVLDTLKDRRDTYAGNCTVKYVEDKEPKVISNVDKV